MRQALEACHCPTTTTSQPCRWLAGGCAACPAPRPLTQTLPFCLPIPIIFSAAVQELFPSSFTSLLRIYNHKAVDTLLVQQDAAAARRERWAAAAAAASRQLKALGGGSSEGKSGSSGSGRIVAWRRRRAAKRLAHAQAEHGKWQQRAAELEQRAEAARQEALARPLGTAFIALFE